MNDRLLYAVGTLLSWAGWFFALKAAVSAVKGVSNPPGPTRKGNQRSGVVSAITAALLFLILAVWPMGGSGVAPTAPLRLPVFWAVMPFWGWLTTFSLVGGILRALQGGLALNPDERMGRFKASGIWFVVALIGYLWFKADPANKVELLTGGIPFQTTTAVAMVLFAFVAVVAMTVAARETATRGAAKIVVTQVALMVGSAIFGLPFLFLLITSFKEPLDMSSPNGIVWVPKVSQKVPYMDRKDRQYQTEHQGTRVTGNIIAHNPDGSVTLNVVRPLSIAGEAFEARMQDLKEVPREAALVHGTLKGTEFTGKVIEEQEDGHRKVLFDSPASLVGQEHVFAPAEIQAIRTVGLNIRNYPDALEFLPPEAKGGFVYLKNTLLIVLLNVIGTLLSSSIVAYAFSRMNFPGRNVLFGIMLSTMMLPAAVTLLPTFLIFRDLHAIDTLFPLWAPAFFSSAFNVFLLRQFFMGIPMELEDAAKIDGCTYLKTFWDIMLPQIKPALAVIAIWTFMGAWNNFMGPLIYINSPEHMPLSYALQLFNTDRGTDEPGLVMAFATMCMAPVLALFFFAQRYFIEGVTLSGLGGR